MKTAEDAEDAEEIGVKAAAPKAPAEWLELTLTGRRGRILYCRCAKRLHLSGYGNQTSTGRTGRDSKHR